MIQVGIKEDRVVIALGKVRVKISPHEAFELADALKRQARRLSSLEMSEVLAQFITHLSVPIRIGKAYEKYVKQGGDKTYKTFQRAVRSLSDFGFIDTETLLGGAHGTTTMITAIRKKV